MRTEVTAANASRCGPLISLLIDFSQSSSQRRNECLCLPKMTPCWSWGALEAVSSSVNLVWEVWMEV